SHRAPFRPPPTEPEDGEDRCGKPREEQSSLPSPPSSPPPKHASRLYSPRVRLHNLRPAHALWFTCAMLLAADVGNTQTVLGLYEDADLRDHWRLTTEHSTTADELGVLLSGLFDLDFVGGICLATS